VGADLIERLCQPLFNYGKLSNEGCAPDKGAGNNYREFVKGAWG